MHEMYIKNFSIFIAIEYRLYNISFFLFVKFPLFFAMVYEIDGMWSGVDVLARQYPYDILNVHEIYITCNIINIKCE